MIHTQFAYLDPDISSGVHPPVVAGEAGGGRSEWGRDTVSIHLQTNYPLERLTLCVADIHLQQKGCEATK